MSLSSGINSRRSGFAVRSSRPLASRSRRPGVEFLEDRQLMATFSVSSLSNVGEGSLRKAILDANATPGADTIDFQVAGTIQVARGSLPVITDTLTIDGTSAPTFNGSPVVTIDFRRTAGLRLDRGADGSTIQSLSLVNAGNSGVTLNASHVTLAGNRIGVLADGTTVAGNRGDGIRVLRGSHDNLIGRSDPVTGISYADASGVDPVPTAWQGIRNSDSDDQYLIVGTSGTNGLLFDGPISGTGGESLLVNYPGATSTSVYGPDNLDGDGLRLVGSYKDGDGMVHGFLFEGTASNLSTPGNYRTIDYPGATYTYVHSTMGGLAVGNGDGPEGNLPIGTGHAFLYDVARSTFLTDIVYPGSTSTTAYGIWFNGGTSYTICGGYTALRNPGEPIGHGFLADYDSLTGQYSNWTSFDDPNGPIGRDFETHFEGISSVEKGVYTLSADSVEAGVATNPSQGSWVSVRRQTGGSFNDGSWVPLNYPGVDPTTNLTSSNSVYGNQVVGLVIGPDPFAFQSTVNIGFQLSNVISGNAGNGIGLYGANDNQIAMNHIGTDASGTIARPNGMNGIQVTHRSARNVIGGQATGGNDPTAGVFVRPPQGNLISGNRANGVLINAGATRNLLSGNFVGTSASGNSALGNRLDGVAIEHADDNVLAGTTFPQSPFVFYNVLSGNGGNGLRVTSSDNVTVHANFQGVGADNATIVPNGGDGLLISGSSKQTQVGGVIPLGNVISGNNRNGIEVRDSASGFISFNTFAGVFAFGGAAPNRLNGILIASSGGNNVIRTSIISGNLGNGIELSGLANGVQITDTSTGTNTAINAAIPNQGSGILIAGHARGNAIGGFQASVEPRVTVSANGRHGIEVAGSARDNFIFNTYIGTSALGTANLGNAMDGIYLGPGTSKTTIGGTSSDFENRIVNNGRNGLNIQSSSGNVVLRNEIRNNLGSGIVLENGRANLIGSEADGNTISGNGQSGVSVSQSVNGSRITGNVIDANSGDGVTLDSARRLTLGGPSPGAGNDIIRNLGFGLFAQGISTGTLVQNNRISRNAKGDVDLSQSTGITYIPGDI